MVDTPDDVDPSAVTPGATQATAIQSTAIQPGARARPQPLLRWWAAIPLAVVAGAVLDLAFPDVGWWPMAFLGVGGALLTLIGRSVGGAFLIGLLFGASFYLIHISWITRYLGVVPWFALSGLESLFMGVLAIPIALAYRWMPRVFPGRWVQLAVLPLLVAGLWTMRELFVGSWPYTGFPWGRIGMSQSESPLASVVSWTGVAGLTFLMVALTAAAIQWLRIARWWDVRTAIPAGAIAAILLLLPAYPTASSGTVTVGSVQGNGPTGYFDQREPNEVLNAQLQASAPLLGEDMDLLVWPEGGMDSDPLRNATTAAALDGLSERADAPLLVAAVTQRGEKYFNTSMVWESGKGATATHDKTRPVPMGEYVPDRWFFEKLAPDLINLIQREYTPGTKPPYVMVGDTLVGLAICFDVLYDDVIWQSARAGAELYVFQTNNADFRDTDENLQQLAFARMRAVETGRSVVNISTVGTSQVIDPRGQTIDSLPADEPGAMLTDVPLRTGTTPAAIIGPAIQWVLGWGSLLVIVLLGVTARRKIHRADALSSE